MSILFNIFERFSTQFIEIVGSGWPWGKMQLRAETGLNSLTDQKLVT